MRCGLLRQLHSTLGRNVAPSYQVVLRKMLRAVEQLPLTADDVHLTRSAHGTFGDILGLLAQHLDVEVPPPPPTCCSELPSHTTHICSLYRLSMTCGRGGVNGLADAHVLLTPLLQRIEQKLPSSGATSVLNAAQMQIWSRSVVLRP